LTSPIWVSLRLGVFEAKGPGAAAFLDLVTTNEVHKLALGDSHYTYLLDTTGQPLDDLMIYRLAADHFLLVVNASNNDKNWAWLNAVKSNSVDIGPVDSLTTNSPFTLRDLRDPSSGADRRGAAGTAGERDPVGVGWQCRVQSQTGTPALGGCDPCRTRRL